MALASDQEAMVSRLRDWNLIPGDGDLICEKCGGALKLVKDCSRLDGRRWWCANYVTPNKKKRRPCGHFVEFRRGTFFGHSKLDIWQILVFVALWVRDTKLTTIAFVSEMSNKTAVDWASFCREVLIFRYLDKPEKLGGPGKIVEIDESKFGKRKYHRGHRVEGSWVFGGYERGSGRVFMVTVEERSSLALVPIIKERIAPGTTIISDCWKAYCCLENEGFQHLTVNHSMNFVDPDTGACTNNIEASWRAAKAITTSAGRKKGHILGNLAKYMFYKSCKETGQDRFVQFLRFAGELYDARKPVEETIVDEAADEEDDEIDFGN